MEYAGPRQHESMFKFYIKKKIKIKNSSQYAL